VGDGVKKQWAVCCWRGGVYDSVSDT